MSDWVVKSNGYIYWPEDLEDANYKFGNNVWLIADFDDVFLAADEPIDALPWAPYILGPDHLPDSEANFACPKSWIVA